MKNNIISAIIICLTALLVSCNYQIVEKPKPVVPKPPKYAGDYDVLQLRSIWAICSQTHAFKAPQIPPNMVAAICDCYVDEMRTKYKQSELGTLTKPQAEAMGHQLMTACNAKIMDKLGRGEALKQNSTYNQNTIPKLL